MRCSPALARAAPGVPVLGGLSSARTFEGTGALFVDQTVCEQGAVGVSLAGVELLPCVSQGAAPLGREMTITAAEGNVIHELAGRPAVETIEQIIGELRIHERALVAGGLLLGIVIDGGKPEYEQGDFLVRGVLGADPATGAVAIGASVAAGQVVRLHARDARSADEDLRRELRLRCEAIGGETAGRRTRVLLQRPRAVDVRGLRPRRDDDRATSSAALPRPASSPPERSGRWAGEASCTRSPPRWPCSRLTPAPWGRA